MAGTLRLFSFFFKLIVSDEELVNESLLYCGIWRVFVEQFDFFFFLISLLVYPAAGVFRDLEFIIF